MDRVLRQLTRQAKLLGQIDKRPVVNVLLVPAWLRIRSAIHLAFVDAFEPNGVTVGGMDSRTDIA